MRKSLFFRLVASAILCMAFITIKSETSVCSINAIFERSVSEKRSSDINKHLNPIPSDGFFLKI